MSETINTLNLLEVQARVSEADEQIIRADERAKVIEEFCDLAFDYLDHYYFKTVEDFKMFITEELKEQN